MSGGIFQLSDVCRISTGQSAPQDPEAFGLSGHPFVRAGSLERLVNGEPEQTLELIDQANAAKYRLRLFPAGTIVFAKSGMSAKLGRVHMLNTPCYVVSHLATVEPSSSVHGRWLLHWFRSNSPTSLIANDAYPSIRTSEIEALELALPEFREQQRMAAILDKSDSLRRKRQEAIRLADEFLKSLFYEKFGDPVTNPKGLSTSRVDQLCEVATGSTPARNRPDYYDGPHPWIKTGEVDTPLIMSAEEYISDAAIAETNCKLFPVGTLLIAMYGQGKTRGKVGMLGIPAATNQACAAILPSPKINRHFLYAQLSLMYEHLRAMGRGGNQENLNLGMIKSLQVLVPPKHLVDEFLGIRERVVEMNSKAYSTQAALDAMAQSLAAKFFA